METVWTEERKDAARAVCQLYAGTPHRARVAIPGRRSGGVDCIHFVDRVLVGAGVIPEHTLPGYDDRAGVFRQRNIIEDILVRHLIADTLPEDAEAAFGDIVICKVGRQSNHVGIVIDGDLWHVPGGGNCCYEHLGNWRTRIQSFVRITALGLTADPAELRASEITDPLTT